ncbi:MAG TPA: tRNA guanosine(34) transglycosylase Tgt [Chthoniobacterales bacterium]|jgi:queuine tRNA-ribosyltransferase
MTLSRLQFQLEATAEGSHARAATFHTLHDELRTPLFMPVGTKATVKAQLPSTLEEAGTQIMLVNTYHLLLRPGPEVLREVGGVHKLMSWRRGVLSDSGGFQIFSLPHARPISKEGAVFQSYVDGRVILLTPELSIETQKAIGSDIMMVLDQCIASTAEESVARAAMEMTEHWAKRSLAARGDSPQSIFAIVQGALFPELRRQGALSLGEMPFDGYAIGGLALGESRSQRRDICEFTAGFLPADKPRYLMGIGTPLDILESVHRGIDLFDCIMPTQLAQRGGVFTSEGFLQLRRTAYRSSEQQLDPLCACPTCARFSRAYLHHLTKTTETLGWQLLGQHNLYFYHQLMRDIRASILAGRFLDFYRQTRERLSEPEREEPDQMEKKQPRKSLSLGDYEVHIAREGFASIRQISSGEIMHLRTPPMEEACSLYVEQSDLAAHLRSSETAPLIIWDVGLGAAANAVAAIQCYEREASLASVRPLHLVSFENDLDSLRLALRHIDIFSYLNRDGPSAILERGSWESQNPIRLRWQLVLGDFLQTVVQTPSAPDLIYYDMFSSRTHGNQWTIEIFRRLFAACAERPVELFTYSHSTAVRTALLAAGFFVARGRPAGRQEETTIALTPAALTSPFARRYQLLASEWISRWHRSRAKFPSEVPREERPAFEQQILQHKQFR